MLLSHISVLILGLIDEKPVNPYEIKKILDRIEVRRWMPVAVSSVYATVKELNRKGFCEGIPEKEGNMPEKTVYSVTGTGRQALLNTLREYIGSTDLDRKKYQISALLLCHLDRDEVIGILKKKCAKLEEMAARMGGMTENMRGRVPYNGLSMIQHELAFIRAETETAKQLLASIEKDKSWNYFVTKNLMS